MIGKINKLIAESIKNRDLRKLEVYKLVKAEFQKAEKSGKTWDPVKVLLGMITTREDSRTQYEAAGRVDLADQEDYEIQVIKTDLLPPLPGQEEMKTSIIEFIKTLPQPVGPKDIKTTLAALSPKFPGLTGKLVSEVIKEYASRT